MVTAPGVHYEVSFALAGNPWGGEQAMLMNVLWNGGLVDSFSHDTTGHTGFDMGWTVYSVVVTGTGLDRLTFAGASGGGAAGPALDAVSMRVVPGPSSLAVVIGAGAFISRRRR